MKPPPLLKRLPRPLSIPLAPFQHLLAELQTHILAIHPQDPLGIVEEVVGINERDLDLRRADLVGGTEEVEEAPQLVVARFGGHEGREAGDGGERRDRAAVVGGDGGARVAD